MFCKNNDFVIPVMGGETGHLYHRYISHCRRLISMPLHRHYHSLILAVHVGMSSVAIVLAIAT